MGYRKLSHCLEDLESRGDLIRIDQEVDAHLEVAAIQRRVFQAQGPALLFTRVKNSSFSMASNLFGTPDRIRYIFRDTLDSLHKLFQNQKTPLNILKDPQTLSKIPRLLWSIRPKKVSTGPVLEKETKISSLPRFTSWPLDGGAFATLPQVYSENPDAPGFKNSNLGMYRIQLSGNKYGPDSEVGLHYQIHRGIAHHHAQALRGNNSLRVNIFIGGPPALTLAAIMPLPEGLAEIFFAGALAGHRLPMVQPYGFLPFPAEADFCISGEVKPNNLLPEGPFGDHLGYYSLTHDFPVISVHKVWHRKDAVWPFTSVGRPPQEDSVIGDLIQEMIRPLVPRTFPGVNEINAVDEAGVHPLLLALGSERYEPFSKRRDPAELLTEANSLLGNSQTSLCKYLLISAKEDNPELSPYQVPEFFRHMLKRVDWQKDLHFITRTSMDTLDYSGYDLNKGSKVIIAASGEPLRSLNTSMPKISWPDNFKKPLMFFPGILLLQGPEHQSPRDTQDHSINELCRYLEEFPTTLFPPLIVICDDSTFAAESWKNFLWVTFSRSDPATDIYGLRSFVHCKHWGCQNTLLIDARLKKHHPPPLEPEQEIEKRVDALGASGRPLHGII